MGERCGVEHPSLPGLSCDKRPDGHIRHKVGNNITWPDTREQQRREVAQVSHPGATPTQIKKGIKDLAERAKRPPEVTKPGVKLRSNPHDTEAGAAEATLPRSGTQRRRVYDLIAAASSLDSEDDGLTDEEIQHRLQMNPSTVRPRRGELVDAGLVKDSGQRRRVGSGEWAIVWVLV